MGLGVRLVSHASVLIEAGETTLLTDPWFSGKAFNDSWALIADAATVDYDTISHLWLSHEHPDHFHIPTLRSLPATFKERVTVLFQQSSDHPKMTRALRGLGFRNIQLLPHKQWVAIGGGAEVLCYQSRQIDSALAVRAGGKVALNLNDCDFGPSDLSEIKRLVGEPDILLNQFSLAGFAGIEAELPAMSARILDDMVVAHRTLGAKLTVPFASFAYFCRDDNAFLNAYANTPRQAAERFATEGLRFQALVPGQALSDAGDALAWWDDAIGAMRTRPLSKSNAVDLASIKMAFASRCRTLERYHGIWRRMLRPVVIESHGLGRLKLDFANHTIGRTEGRAELEIAAQPLHHMLKHDFGLQALGVSGCYRLTSQSRNWMLHRVLFGMVNAGIGLSLRQLLNRRQVAYLWSRRHDLLRQVIYTLRHQMPAFTIAKPMTTASDSEPALTF